MAATDHHHLVARCRCRRCPGLAARPALPRARRPGQRQAAPATAEQHGGSDGPAGGNSGRGRRRVRLLKDRRGGAVCSWGAAAAEPDFPRLPRWGSPGAGKRSQEIGWTGGPAPGCPGPAHLTRSEISRSRAVGQREAERSAHGSLGSSSPRPASVSFPRLKRSAWKRNLPEARDGNPPPAGPRSPTEGREGAEAMDGAGTRREPRKRGSRLTAPRGRGVARGAARSSSRGRGRGGAATAKAPQGDGSVARRGRPARAASIVRSLPAGPAPCGEEAPPAPQSRAAAARAPATRKRTTVPDGAVAAPVSTRRPPVAAGGLRLREVLSRLTLGRQDVSEASGLVNRVVSHLIQAIRSTNGSFSSIERLGAGSYYEHVKVSEPDEFDIMLVMPVLRLQLEECDDTGAYYYVSFKRNPKEKCLLKFLDEDGKLSAFKMIQALRDIIKREVKNIKDVEVTVKRKKAGSPAITLLIKNPPAEISVDIILTLEVQQSWPPSTQDGLKIEQWLGRKVRRKFRNGSLYLVAKQNKNEKVLRGNTWRLSFSHIEKAMMNNHGSSKTCCESDGPKCCRKGCLKLLKYLLEQLKMKHPKELEKICSYHVKTAFFHSCVMWPNDTDWCSGDLDHCFQKYLGYFLDCLQKSHLPHFFIPQYNLLSVEDKASSNLLSRQINFQLNNGFPIFHERC
ncbi:LOW QUALITY PROTEIN: cyclic GMP-AMP synthase [Phaethornis superciliosus]